MFINEVITIPKYVDGRKFVERTINSKFNKGNVSITTIYMNDEPIAKQYVFDMVNKLSHFWKSLKKESNVKELTVYKPFDKIG